jgi:uncharacterized protein YaaR (DUF327 family)
MAGNPLREENRMNAYLFKVVSRALVAGVLGAAWGGLLCAAEKDTALPFFPAAGAAKEKDAAKDQTKDAAKDAEPSPFAPIPDRRTNRDTDKKKLDPVASAYALPRRTVLNDKQNEAMKKLRDRTEKGLRAALDEVEKAGDVAAKTAAAKKVKTLKNEIRGEINKILDMPAAEQAKRQAEAMKKAADQTRKNAARYRRGY